MKRKEESKFEFIITYSTKKEIWLTDIAVISEAGSEAIICCDFPFFINNFAWHLLLATTTFGQGFLTTLLSLKDLSSLWYSYTDLTKCCHWKEDYAELYTSCPFFPLLYFAAAHLLVKAPRADGNIPSLGMYKSKPKIQGKKSKIFQVDHQIIRVNTGGSPTFNLWFQNQYILVMEEIITLYIELQQKEFVAA